MKLIDSFFVIDFDRCLGNVDANFRILKEVIHELHIDDARVLQSARDDAEALGLSFDAFDYVRGRHPSIDLKNIEKKYLELAKTVKGSLLEDGASELIDFLRATGRQSCIMSYGDERWQTLKIIAAGFHDIPKVIVPNKQKSLYIRQWANNEDDAFSIPGSCFLDGRSRRAREVVLIDDKVGAFEDMPDNTRGYLVRNTPEGDMPLSVSSSFVRRVTSVYEIIGLESSRLQ